MYIHVIMLHDFVHTIPLPFGTNIGEVVESIAAGKLLTHIMKDECNNCVDDAVDKMLAYTMVFIAVSRKHKKRK
jgi:hypothetical protein